MMEDGIGAATGADWREIRGVRLAAGYLSPTRQRALVDAVGEIVAAAPLVRPVTPWGRPMSVQMTSAGRVGWVIAGGRYGYAARHPGTGRPWPPIPPAILAVWREVSGWPGDPDSCLVNWYGEGARMGLHRDADEGEEAFAAPVVSISLGDPARFRIGGLARRGPTESVVLRSGDVVVMGGPARLAYHGVDRVFFGESDLVPGGGRINLTLRVVRSA